MNEPIVPPPVGPEPDTVADIVADTEKASHGRSVSRVQAVHEAVHCQEEVRVEHSYDGFTRLFLWYPIYLPKDERELLIKLDYLIFHITFCLSCFTKSLEKSNITNAYITNMKEDINMTGK